MADTTKAAGGAGGDALGSFVESVRGFFRDVTGAMVAAAGNDPDGSLIQSTAQTILAQVDGGLGEVQRVFASGSRAAQSGAAAFATMSNGVGLAQSSAETARTALERGVGRGFFSWLPEIVKEVKKIVRMILEFFGKVPRWWDLLATLIDELVNLAVKLLGGVFGFNRREIAAEASAGEVNFMREMRALTQLRNAVEQREEEEEE